MLTLSNLLFFNPSTAEMLTADDVSAFFDEPGVLPDPDVTVTPLPHVAPSSLGDGQTHMFLVRIGGKTFGEEYHTTITLHTGDNSPSERPHIVTSCEVGRYPH